MTRTMTIAELVISQSSQIEKDPLPPSLFFSRRRRHTRWPRDWSSDVCSSDLVKEGLDPVTALRAVTIHPAQIIGCAGRIGSLEVGKDADVVLWSGDPLDVMSRAERAYQDGREIYRYDYERREGVFADVWAAR